MPSKRLVVASYVISGLVSLVFLMSATMKFIGGPGLAEGMAHLGIPLGLTVPIGVLEVTCVLVYLVPATSVLGAVLLTGYVGGAILTHLRVGDPFIVQVLLGAFAWLGVYLREPRVRALLPIRR